jgi:hypothetical protein
MAETTTKTDTSEITRSEKRLVDWLRRQSEVTRYVVDGVSDDELVAEYKANHAAKLKRIARRIAGRERLASFRNMATSRHSILSIS